MAIRIKEAPPQTYFGVQMRPESLYVDSVDNPKELFPGFLEPKPLKWRYAKLQQVSAIADQTGQFYPTFLSPSWNLHELQSNFGCPHADWIRLASTAREKWDNSLRKGNLSMGVQLAKYMQTRDHLVQTWTDIVASLAGAERYVRSMKQDKLNRLRRLQRSGKLLSGHFLAGYFGLANLLSNSKGLIDDFTKDAIIGHHILTKRSQEYFDTGVRRLPQTYVSDYVQTLGSLKVTLSGGFELANPNYYLANRAGLLDLPGIAWDLVPWSWVVNMISNSKQVIGQFTADVGLNLLGPSTTYTARYYMWRWGERTRSDFPGKGSSYREVMKLFAKTRVVGNFPPILPRFKAPQLDASLAAVAAALALQKTRNIAWIIEGRKSRPLNWKEIFPPGYQHL